MSDSGMLLTADSSASEPIHRDTSSLWRSIEHGCLQVAHRLGTVALFATIAAWVLIYRGQNYQWPVIAAFAAADLGFCAGILAGLIARRTDASARREALGVTIFNLILLAMSLQLVLISRIDVIRAAASQFFTPD